MDFSDIEARGLVLLGCGKMGSALLQGWLGQGLAPGAVHVIDPAPPAWLGDHPGIRVNGPLPGDPAVLVIAVKPQLMDAALPQVSGLSGALVISVAAGTPIAAFEAAFGADAAIVRAMPNTPAAIGQGITALVGNRAAGEPALALAEGLLSAVGETVRLPSEDLMDAVTAVSGSGPAYVFLLIETLAAAGEAEGLPPDLALRLARATVAGAGALAQAEAGRTGPDQLRVNVTSPGGTTAAALEVLMDDKTGFPALLRRAVHAAAERSRELSK